MKTKVPIILLIGGLLAFAPLGLAYWTAPYGPYDSPAIEAPTPVGGISLWRWNLPDAYVVEITLYNLQPSNVDIERNGFGFDIRSNRDYDLNYRSDGGWFSYYYGFDHFNRRVRLPLNADTYGLQRIDGDHMITVWVPKVWLW